MARLHPACAENQFVMLGIIHRDAEGERLLSGWLEQSRPAVITLEFSPFGLDFRKANAALLKSRVCRIADELSAEGRQVNEEAVKSVLSFIDVPAEFNILSAYAARCKVPLFLIDVDYFSYVKLKDIERLVAKENLEKLVAAPPATDVRHEKTLARLFFEKGVNIVGYTDEMRVRDRFMRDKIALLRKNYTGSRFLHVCGWQHLSDPHHLYQELNPTKVFIYDKTLCI
jgi:hypothetical protein